ncbi:MAG: cobyric acid synthase [Acidobacteriota bacterium]|jgi:cobyric acid synthase CobQ/L-threonine-O-3-phosphate decarboxylase|nr:cobyric acid synthase [Acidobacteriota bacterium]
MKHGGNLRMLTRDAGNPERRILDFSASINPLGPPEWLRPLISSHIRELAHYPDPDCETLTDAVAEHCGVRTDEVIVGNGSSELLYLLPRVLGDRGIIPVPSYGDYARACLAAGKKVITLPLREQEEFRLNLQSLDAMLVGGELVFIGQPNNPTGTLCDPASIRALAAGHPDTSFVADEAFADFIEGIGGADRLFRNRPANLTVLLSLTKNFAIPGLRLGCAISDPSVIRRMRELQAPWPVNALAQAVGEAALRDADYLRRMRRYVSAERERLVKELRNLDHLTVFPGHANFLLVRIDRPGLDAPTLAGRLLANGVAIRVCDNFEGLDERFFRIAVRTEEENARLCQLLGNEFPGGPAGVPVRSRKPAIMFQGTGSNAGKSILTAALCRILLQDGFRVAPFKSQNMSLNSFVTRDAGEMGRAQVVQAQACRIEPDVRMNPILLKPNSDTGSQVIVLGKPVGNMNVDEYIRYKPEAFRTAKEAFDQLAREYDAVVLEGAGSPAEVNLKSHDIVNMNMARHANAPVLLVGDIDRGGVFAAFVGTMEVLAEWERDLVAGFVINRFRGKESLLGDAIEYTRRHTGKPVLGVVPYLHSLGLPEEDSVTFKSMALAKEKTGRSGVEVAIIDLPHISNFTDFDAFINEPDVTLRIVHSARELDAPDAIILPGSKNVIGDMAYLRQSGLDHRISELSATTEIVGICGGYQMLGDEISDAIAIESSGCSVPGLGLLPLTTRMAAEKTLRYATATHLDSQLLVRGYEIHHGISGESRWEGRGADIQPAVLRSDGTVVGIGRGHIWGTYLHGIFDADDFRRWFIDRLRLRRGLEPLNMIAAPYDLEPAFERLADVVRKSLRMDEVYKLMGLR